MKQRRYHSLDAARGMLMMIGVYFHIIVFHYSDSWLGYLGMSTHYFRMHAFFLISGFFSALVLYRKGHYEMLNNRFKRIFLPLIIFAWPTWILVTYSTKFNELRYENKISESLKQSFFQYTNEPWTIFPWETMHLWFLSLLVGMSLLSYALKNRLSNSIFLRLCKESVRLIFDKPWAGMLVCCSSYGILLSIMNKFEAQGDGGWSSWIWFLKDNGIKTFVAFSFFYFVGWQMYHYRAKLLSLSPGKYFKILLIFSLFLNIPAYSLYYVGYNNPMPMINTMHRNFYGLNDYDSTKERKKQKVTFLVNMSKEPVIAGEGDTASVYICVMELEKPSGIKMNDLGNGIWKASLELKPGIYHYKFRNGLHSEWISEEPNGWEIRKNIGDGGCGYDHYNNRKFKLENKDLILGIFCWSDCTDCSGNEIPVAFYKEDLETKLINRVFIFLMNFLVPVYIMLVLSLFVKFCSKPSKKLKYISDSAYWIYIIHLPLSFLIPAFFHQTKIHFLLKFIISSSIVTIICFGTYHFFVRKTFLGKFLNGRKYR